MNKFINHIPVNTCEPAIDSIKKKKNKKYLARLLFELLKRHTYAVEKVVHVYYISVLVYCKLKIFHVKN